MGWVKLRAEIKTCKNASAVAKSGKERLEWQDVYCWQVEHSSVRVARLALVKAST